MCKWFGVFGVICLVFLGRFAFNIWDISLGSYFSEMELAASRFF